MSLYYIISVIFIFIFSINASAMPTRPEPPTETQQLTAPAPITYTDGRQLTAPAPITYTDGRQLTAPAPITYTDGKDINDCFIQKPYLWPCTASFLGTACGMLQGVSLICCYGTNLSTLALTTGSCCCCCCVAGSCAAQIVMHAPPPIQGACAYTADYCLEDLREFILCKRCGKKSRHRRPPLEAITTQPIGTSRENPYASFPLGPMTTQPTRRPSEENPYEILLINRVFNKSSLQNTRNMLLGATEGTIHALKQLIFKGHALYSEKNEHVLNIVPSTKLTRLYRYAVQSIQRPTKSIQYPIKIFGFVDSYEKSLTQKHRPGRVGLVMFLNPHTSIAFAYNHNTNEKRLFTNSSTHTGMKLSQVKTTLDGCSIALTINPHNPGFTSSLAACYNFGTTKTSRYYSHGHSYIKAKGSPSVSMHGWIGLLGYNIPISNTCVIIPYLEGVVSMSNWSNYKEKASFTPYYISKNKEYITEASFGLRSSLFATPNSQFQGWIASVSGIKKRSALHSQVHNQAFRAWHNHTLPKSKTKYQNIEIGIGYENQIMEHTTLGMTASLRLKQAYTSEKQNLTMHINYVF